MKNFHEKSFENIKKNFAKLCLCHKKLGILWQIYFLYIKIPITYNY